MLELHTFGGLALRREDGERLEALAGRTKCLALLAYLAAEARDGRVPRAKAAALLWPGRTDERARNSLRVALSEIRRATDGPLVVGEGEASLGLADRVRADVAAFEEALAAGEAARALELYRGDFLAGVRIEGARPFRRWADQRRGAYRRRAYEAALSVGADARATGDLAAAEAAFRRALDLAPLREEAAGRLIRTLADRGRAADAVQLFDAFRERRRQELQLAPSEELEALVERIKSSPPAGAIAAGDPKTRRPEEPDARHEASASGAEESPDADPPGTGSGPDSADGAAGTGSGGSPFSTTRGVQGLVAVGLAAAAVAGGWYLLGSGGEPAPAAGDRSVAVLPFEAIGTENPGPIAEGLHNDLLTRLSNVSGLKVISATSVERFRGTELPLPAIADSLGVKWVVEGDVQRADGTIQVNAQLVDARTDAHAWAETYRRELTADNLFDLQRTVAGRIARSLDAEIDPRERDRLRRARTENLQAYRLYLRGRSLLAQRTDVSTSRALGYFRRALQRDSSYALAWSGLSDAAGLRRMYGFGVADTLGADPEEAARRAVAIDSSLAEAHASLGRVYADARHGPAAVRELRRAIELRPSYARAHHWLGMMMARLGRPGESVEHLERAVAIDPLSPITRLALADCYYWDRRYRAALRELRKIRASGTRLGASSLEGIVLSALGRQGEAVAALRRGLQRDVSPTYRRDARAWLAVAHARAGNAARARQIVAQLSGRPGDALRRAFPLAALGEIDAALDALGEARFDRAFLIPFLRYDAVLEPVRERPEFGRILRRVNRAWGLDPDGSLPDSSAPG